MSNDNPKHTPGPWVVEHLWVRGPGNVAVISICGTMGAGNDDTNKANAHLIAAAPDMLEALEAILSDCDQFLGGSDQVNLSLSMVEAAIKKAKEFKQ